MILTTSKGGGVGVGREVVSGGATDGGGVEGGMSSILKKGPWSAAEDTVLIEYVKKHGEGNWNAVQRNTGLQRCGKSCRLRWANHLRPNLKKGAFSSVEERLIIDLHSKLGNKWARISAHVFNSRLSSHLFFFSISFFSFCWNFNILFWLLFFFFFWGFFADFMIREFIWGYIFLGFFFCLFLTKWKSEKFAHGCRSMQ